jgi:hypothetical protein
LAPHRSLTLRQTENKGQSKTITLTNVQKSPGRCCNTPWPAIGKVSFPMTALTIQPVQERKRRGLALLTAAAGNVAQVSRTMYLVRGSESSDYKVVLTAAPLCECKDFHRHGSTLGTCKHIEAVRVFNRIYQLIER